MQNATINFFLKNKESLADYIGKIKVNKDKTLVKYGFMKGKNVSITFMIYGDLDDSIITYEEKIEHMFDTLEDLSNLNEFIEKINLPYTFHFNPFIKISKENEALTYAFNIAAKFIK